MDGRYYLSVICCLAFSITMHPFVLGQRDLLTAEEAENLRCHLQTNNLWSELREVLKTNGWANDSKLVALLEAPLMRLCAGYLYVEKRRGYALDNVGMTDALITAM
jgi:malonyl-CoA decarboxylase